MAGGGRRSPTASEVPCTPARVDAHEALLVELQRVPQRLGGGDTPQQSGAVNKKEYEEQQEFHDLGRQAMRHTIGLRAGSQHRRLAGHREARRERGERWAVRGGRQLSARTAAGQERTPSTLRR